MESFATRLFVATIGAACVLSTHVLADPPPDLQSRRIQPQDEYARAAMDLYGEGYALIERATRYEHDANAAPTDHARTEALRGAAQAYEDGLQSFEQAIEADERMYEAHTYIGYIHRKRGRYNESMWAYATALQLKPDYARAIEYQGEAYLGLNQFDKARFNYLRLYAIDQAQAAKLLKAMRIWVDEQRAEGKGVTSEKLEAAAQWLSTQQLTLPVSEAW